jgi:hypothetical protein
MRNRAGWNELDFLDHFLDLKYARVGKATAKAERQVVVGADLFRQTLTGDAVIEHPARVARRRRCLGAYVRTLRAAFRAPPGRLRIHSNSMPVRSALKVMAISTLYVRQRTEQSDARAHDLISSPANNFSSFIDWRVPAPGYAHFRGLLFLSDTRSHDLYRLTCANVQRILEPVL